MTRRSYFDLLKNQGFDAQHEIQNIMGLLTTKSHRSISLRYYIESNFIEYKNRKSFIEFRQLEQAIDDEYDNFEDFLFGYTEMLLDIFKYTVDYEITRQMKYNKDDFMVRQYSAIHYQIQNFLSLSNHELIEDADGNSIIVEKNSLSTQASQILSDTDLQNALKILEYNHFRNQGDIDRKKEILKSLADLLEPKRPELEHKLTPLFKKSNSGKVIILKDVFEMFNKIQVRHNNKEQYIPEDNKKYLEYWYDNIYNTVLMIIVAEDQIKILDELKTLKESLSN